MKRDYILYILLLLLVFLSALIIWPNRWINIDFGNFHYHKEWVGPTLSDLTLGKVEGDLNFDLGKDFRGGSEYKFQVIFGKASDDKAKIVSEAVEVLRKRLYEAGFAEGSVNFKKEGEEHFILLEVPASTEEFELSVNTITQEGELTLWGEKGQDAISQGDAEFDSSETDPFMQFIKQRYTPIDMDLSNFKGERVGKSEDVYFVGIGLNDEQAKKLKEQLYLFWGKSIIALVDGAMLPVDGSNLGEQFSLYGEARSIRLTGFSDKQEAKLTQAVIGNGLLGVKLVAIESRNFDPVFGDDFLDKGILAGGIALIAAGFVFITLFKKEGLAAVFSVIFFLLLSLAGMKVFNITLTLGSIFAFIIIVCNYVGLLFYTYERRKKDASFAEGNLEKYIRDKDIVKFTNNFLMYQLVIGLILFIFSPVTSKYFAFVLLIGTTLEYFMLDQIVPSFYRIKNLFKK